MFKDFDNDDSVKIKELYIRKIFWISLIFVDIQVIDMLLFKGMEELKNVVDHSKQRHHIIGQYVVGQQVQDSATKDQGTSTFLKNFYNTNYFWSLVMSCVLFPQIKNYLKTFFMSILDEIILLVSDQTPVFIFPGLI